MNTTQVLLVLNPALHERSRAALSPLAGWQLTFLDTLEDASARLALPTAPDMLVIDKSIDGAYDWLSALRVRMPRLLMMLIDEGADFAMPGAADDVTTTPFENDDLARRIQRLIGDRKMETLRADAMPPVRDLGQRMRKAGSESGIVQAAIGVVADLGYSDAAVFKLDESRGNALVLVTHQGAADVRAALPSPVPAGHVLARCALSGQMELLTAQKHQNFALVERGRLHAAAIVPVGIARRYGVLLASRDDAGEIPARDVLMLELIAAQLGSYLARSR